jgi:hypothetical protein
MAISVTRLAAISATPAVVRAALFETPAVSVLDIVMLPWNRRRR